MHMNLSLVSLTIRLSYKINKLENRHFYTLNLVVELYLLNSNQVFKTRQTVYLYQMKPNHGEEQ
jgi:hypothetical protein